jgi:hypothetical protein
MQQAAATQAEECCIDRLESHPESELPDMGSTIGRSVGVLGRRGFLPRNDKVDRFAGEDLMRRIGNLKKNLVRARFQSDHDDGVFICVRPGPMPVVDGHMKMTQT